jgi:hypothetical protein
LKAGVENVGLLKTYEALKPVEEDKGETARKLVQHLERFPADMERGRSWRCFTPSITSALTWRPISSSK